MPVAALVVTRLPVIVPAVCVTLPAVDARVTLPAVAVTLAAMTRLPVFWTEMLPVVAVRGFAIVKVPAFVLMIVMPAPDVTDSVLTLMLVNVTEPVADA